MRVIVAGSRTATRAHVLQAILRCPWSGFISQVISGTARGADQHGERWAYENQLPVATFPADWEVLGKRAGPLRNMAMAQAADGLIAAWDGESAGTKNMFRQAKSMGLRIGIWRFDVERWDFVEAQGPTLDIWEAAEERAAVMEICDVSRHEAERHAGKLAARRDT